MPQQLLSTFLAVFQGPLGVLCTRDPVLAWKALQQRIKEVAPSRVPGDKARSNIQAAKTTLPALSIISWTSIAPNPG